MTKRDKYGYIVGGTPGAHIPATPHIDEIEVDWQWIAEEIVEVSNWRDEEDAS